MACGEISDTDPGSSLRSLVSFVEEVTTTSLTVYVLIVSLSPMCSSALSSPWHSKEPMASIYIYVCLVISQILIDCSAKERESPANGNHYM